MSVKPGKKKINLALQGGGSHGAFTWGVLDAMLEDGRFEFDGISATSAGSMNAAVLAHGLWTGGPERAREDLEKFWGKVSNSSAFYAQSQQSAWLNPFGMTNPFAAGMNAGNAAMFGWLDTMSRYVSPYDYNVLDLNPLRDILHEMLDFSEIHRCDFLNLFVCATNVRTGEARIFGNEDMSVDVLLASAALPSMFKAVKIGKDYFWDGGYTGNPALWPLFYHARSRDILIVHVNPIRQSILPKTAQAIGDRLNEITFNSSLLKELRAISFVKKLIREDMMKDEYKEQYKDILLHAIRADKILDDFSSASKIDTSWPFLTSLRDLGRKEAHKWIKAHFDKVGLEDSVDIQKDYLEV